MDRAGHCWAGSRRRQARLRCARTTPPRSASSTAARSRSGIRFGCTGDVNAPKAFSVAFDEADRTLRIRAAPNLTRDDPAVAAIAGDAVEAVEGFWLPRPWLLADGCPALPSPSQLAPADAEAAADTPPAAVAPAATQRIGIARFFTKTDFRTGRRDQRPYEAVSVLAADKQPSAEGL